MDKSEILVDLRKQFGPGSYLYANDIAVLLNKPSVGSVYELMKRKGGLPWPILHVGKSPAVSIYDVAASLAGEDLAFVKKVRLPELGKPVLPAPKHKVNKELTKALNLLRAQQHFLGQICAEIDMLVLIDEVPIKVKETESLPKKPRKSTKIRV